MKKILLSAAALLTLLFAASCQKEDFSGADGEFATVTLTVQAPASPVTKAFGDGTNTNLRLDFGVFDENGEVLDALRQTDIEFGAADSEGKRSTTVKVNLAKGKTYNFVCWAQDNSLDCYNHTDLKAITVDYSKNNSANEEKRDAFYACVKSDIVKADYTQTITLTRPFAQLNVGSDDLKEAEKAGLDTTKLYVELSVTNCPNVLNADFAKQAYTVDTDASLPSIATFTKAICPATVEDSERINVELNGTPKSYSWLSMNYIFTSVSKDDLKEVTFKLYEEGTHLVTYTEDNVPFQANWRTNLLGRLLTTDGELTVVIDPNFANVHNIYLDAISQAALKTAIDNKVAGTYNVSGYVHAVAAAGTDLETVTLKDDKDEANPTETRDYTLSVVGLKSDDTFYQEGDYLVVSVTVDAEGEVSNAQNHVYHRPAKADDEEVVEPVTPKLSLAMDATPVPAEGGNVKVKVTSNVAWTLSLNGSKVAEGSEAVADHEVEVEVPANEETQEVTHTLVLSDVPAEGATATTETFEFKQAAAEAEQPEEPGTDQVLPDGSYYVVVNGKVATPLTSNYGYLQVGNGRDNTEANAFMFTYVPEQNAYTIQDANRYYYYQSESYNSFNRSETLPEAGAYWTIEKDENNENKYRITNKSVSKTIQYDPKYNTYGSYSTVEALLPELLTLDTAIPYVVLSETSISVDPSSTYVKFQVFANVAWTASVEGEATISPSSGSADAEILVEFEENTSTEKSKIYTVTVSSVNGNELLNITHSKVQLGDTVTDFLTADMFKATSTTYTEFSGVKASSNAVYAGKSAKTSTGGIQLRSSKSEDGIVTTASGGNIRKVKVVWESTTTSGRTLDIYVSSEAYTSASELYGDNLIGEKIGSIVCGTSTELEISGDYPYVGLRSYNGAMYLESIELIYE